MKSDTIIRHLISGLLLFAAIVITACHTDPDPTAQETTTAMLIANTWKIQRVTVDNTDQTGSFTGLTLKFTETSYTTTHGNVVWPASGTWTFITEDGQQIKRDDGVEIKTEVTDNSLRLTLNWAKTTLNSGRVNAVAGVHVFTFIK